MRPRPSAHSSARATTAPSVSAIRSCARSSDRARGRSPWRWWRSNRGAPPRHAAKTVRIGARARHATGPAAWTSCIDGGMNAPPSRIPLASR
jgi:hypothetical protein